jgi:hypothetical protein
MTEAMLSAMQNGMKVTPTQVNVNTPTSSMLPIVIPPVAQAHSVASKMLSLSGPHAAMLPRFNAASAIMSMRKP